MRLIVLGCGGRERFSSLPQTRRSNQLSVAVIEILVGEPKLANKNVKMIMSDHRRQKILKGENIKATRTSVLPRPHLVLVGQSSTIC